MFQYSRSGFISIFLIAFGVFRCDATFSRINNGMPAEKLEAPYMVAVIARDTNVFYCGGSILSKRTIITAAFGCISDISNNAAILAGSNNLASPDVQKTNIFLVLIHANFSTLHNNIALGYLDRELKFSETIQPIALDTSPIKGEVQATVYGWGERGPGGPISETLNKLELTTMYQETCALYHEAIVAIDDSHICTQSDDGEPCRKDAGGPLVKDGKMIGVFSYSFGFCGQHVPNTHSRVSYFADWILLNMI